MTPASSRGILGWIRSRRLPAAAQALPDAELPPFKADVKQYSSNQFAATWSERIMRAGKAGYRAETLLFPTREAAENWIAGCACGRDYVRG